ncbi:UTRA domain-containing protein [Actinomadura atramentaria]|uniref:UTRA domain-containing protein n=1 Tax=Actinomadura atramentaria TaxID=1990 RepID=UPI00039E3FA0|nr:UTRA domain-containing protein [Actinomadura atramentaria]
MTATSTPIARRAMHRYTRRNREHQGGGGPFDFEVRALGMTPRVESAIGRVQAPAEVSAVLGTDDVVSRARRMFADDVPVQLATSYIPADIAAGTALEQQATGPGGMISRLADLGYAQVRMTERITVRPPTEAEADFFAMSADQAVYEIVHVGHAADRAVEVCHHVLPAHRWVLDYEWNPDAAN